VEFVWIRHPKVENPAQVPISALSHWEAEGWERIDAPAKPPRPPRRTGKPERVRAPRPPAPPVSTAPAAVEKSADTAKPTKAPKNAPRREED